LDSIPGYVSGLDYTALGKVSNRTYGNGLVSKLDYFSDSFRLKTIKTASIQNLSYSYDGVGNVVVMNDSVNGSFWSFGYDSLDRLLSADELGGLYQWFNYSSIGNILAVHVNRSLSSDFFQYNYSVGVRPHAVVSYEHVVPEYAPYNVTASCSGVAPPGNGLWNITANTSCVGGLVRLNESSTVFVNSNKSLTLSNASLDAAGFLAEPFVLLDSGSVWELSSNSTVYLDDVPIGSRNASPTVYFTYDENGNMVNDSSHFFTYNEDNRLYRVFNQSGNLKEEYLYDHSGNRKVKLTVLAAD